MSDTTPTSRLTNLSDISGIFSELDQNYVPHLSVNCVVFGYREGCLQVLLHHLLPIKNWGLPGAYVRRDQSLDQTATSLIERVVGLKDAFTTQFHTFGGVDRVVPAGTAMFRALGVEPPPGHWVVGRVVSVGYFALVDIARTALIKTAPTEEFVWLELTQVPPLAYDHNMMIEKALTYLREQLDVFPLDKNLLPKTFTMPELQRLYEAVHGKMFDRRNFQKRVLDLGLVERLKERRMGGPNRPAYLYRWISGISD